MVKKQENNVPMTEQDEKQVRFFEGLVALCVLFVACVVVSVVIGFCLLIILSVAGLK